MNLRRAKTVYVKELTDILRDHRTLVAMVLVPIVLYPLIMLGGVQAVSGQTTDLDHEKITLGFSRSADWDVLAQLLSRERRILERQRAKAIANGASEDELAKLPRPLADQLADPKATSQLDDAVRQHTVYCGVVVQNAGWTKQGANPADPVVLTIKFQPEDIRSEYAAERLQGALQRVADDRTRRRLDRLGIDHRITQTVVIANQKMTTSGSILGLILPLVLVLMTITGAIYPAIDLTAGERERGTLESLMASPVPTIDLIVGKFLVVTTIAIVGAGLNLASVTATIYFGGIDQILDTDPSSSASGFPLHVLPVILLSLIPFAVFMSAIMIAVCSCARTFKEAQNYVTPLIIAVVTAGGVAALPGARLTGVMVVTPVANMVLLTRELLSGVTVAPAIFVWVMLSTSLYAATAVIVAAQVFGRESVVFADSISLRAALSRRLISPRRFPSLTVVGLYTALLFPVWFHVQGLLQRASDGDVRELLSGTAVLMPIFFVGVPLLMLKWRKTDTRASLSLSVPGPAMLAISMIVGLTAWIPSHEIFVFQEHYLGSPPAIAEMNKAMTDAVSTMPVPLVFLLLAIIPAICEELFFRGFLLRGLRSSIGTASAVVISGIVFAVFHFFIFKFVATAMLGIILGSLCWRSKSIWPSMISHALHNALMVSTVVAPSIWTNFGLSPDETWQHLPTGVLVGGLALFAVGIVGIAFSPTPPRQNVVRSPAT